MLQHCLGCFEHSFSAQRATHSQCHPVSIFSENHAIHQLHAVVKSHYEELPVELVWQQLWCGDLPGFQVAGVNSWILTQPNETNHHRALAPLGRFRYSLSLLNPSNRDGFHSKGKLCHQNRASQTKFSHAKSVVTTTPDETPFVAVSISTYDPGFPTSAAGENVVSFSLSFSFSVCSRHRCSCAKMVRNAEQVQS